MKVLNTLFSVSLLLILFTAVTELYAQSEPVLYFCERYDSYDHEIGVRDRYRTGEITVVVKSDYELDLRKVHIQFDRYNVRTREFEFYKKFDYDLERDMNYVYFSKNEDSDMSFDDPGFYRVFLLDSRNETVASALIEIIE